MEIGESIERLQDELNEQDKALEEAEKIIKWVSRWVGDFKSKEAKEWLDKYGTQENTGNVKLDK